MEVSFVNDAAGAGLPAISDERKAEIEDAAFFYASILMHPRTVKTLTIDIAIDPDLEVNGECVNEDDTNRSRWFTITLNDNSEEDILQTLAHEMVHVKQHVKNELKKETIAVRRGNAVALRQAEFWKGEQWVPKKREDPYFDSPWEVEAFGKEVGLYSRWKTFYHENYNQEIA